MLLTITIPIPALRMRRSCFAALSLLMACTVVHAADDDAPTYAFGAGVQRLPAWQGAKDRRNQGIPYVDIEIPGVGELSTSDGLKLESRARSKPDTVMIDADLTGSLGLLRFCGSARRLGVHVEL